MADITVRKMDFPFPDDVPLVADPTSLERSMGNLGLSFTLPHLEPYLIRTMRVGVKAATDPVIAQDMRNFSAQEGYHFRNHAKSNSITSDRISAVIASSDSSLTAAPSPVWSAIPFNATAPRRTCTQA